jgi:hypothetical protein
LCSISLSLWYIFELVWEPWMCTEGLSYKETVWAGSFWGSGNLNLSFWLHIQEVLVTVTLILLKLRGVGLSATFLVGAHSLVGFLFEATTFSPACSFLSSTGFSA